MVDIEVAPVAPTPLAVTAQPNRTRFTTPAQPADVGRNDLVDGLKQFDSGLSDYIDQKQTQQDAADKLQGEADFAKNNETGYADGVANGTISAAGSPAYVNAYKGAQGALAGTQLQAQFKAAYDAWPGKTNIDDPGAYSAFARDFVSRNVGTTDPAVLAGLMPKVNQMTDEGYRQNVIDHHNTVQQGYRDTSDALIASDIGTMVAYANTNGVPVDPQAIASHIGQYYTKAVSLGVNPEQARQDAIEQIKQSALQNKGHHGDEVIQALDYPITPGGLILSQTTQGAEAKTQVQNVMETYQKQTQLSAQKALSIQQKADIADATAQAQDILKNDPTAPIPPEIIQKAVNAGDGGFQGKVAQWTKQFAQAGEVSDPAALHQLKLDIMGGATADDVRIAFTKGGISPSDLASSLKEVTDHNAAAPQMKALTETEAYKQTMSTITLQARDTGKLVFGAPVGASPLAQGLQYEINKNMQDWIAANPNASSWDTQQQFAKVSASVQQMITKPATEDTGGVGTLPAGNPFAGVRPTVASQYTTGMPTPTQVASPPVPVSSAVDTRTPAPQAAGAIDPAHAAAVTTWAATLTPAQHTALIQEAARSGKSIDTIAGLAYDKQVAAGKVPGVKPPPDPSKGLGGLAPLTGGSSTQPMPARSVMGADGTVIHTDAQGNALNPDGTKTTSTEAAAQQLKGAMTPPAVTPAGPQADMGLQAPGSFETAVRKWAATDPDAAAKVHQFTAIIQGLHSQLPYQGSMTLAALKGNPQASHLLDFVAGPESGGNYNAYYGHAGSTKDLSGLTLNQVLQFQHNLTAVEGLKSSATGRYQFMPDTLRSLMGDLHLTGNEKFTPEMQDTLALALLKRRGLDSWQQGTMSDSQFANNLASEWASLPNMQTGRSQYDGDGLNKSLVTPGQVAQRLQEAKGLSSAPAAEAISANAPKVGTFTPPASTPTPPVKPVDAYANIPAKDSSGADQIAKFKQWNSDPQGNQEANLAAIHPDLAAVVRKASAENPGLFVVGNGKRTAEEQNQAQAWGWSKVGAPGKGSLADYGNKFGGATSHMNGTAVDLWGTDKDGHVQFKPAQQQQIAAAMKRAAAELKVPLNWGGDWKSFKDMPHFELAGKGPGAAIKAAGEGGEPDKTTASGDEE